MESKQNRRSPLAEAKLAAGEAHVLQTLEELLHLCRQFDRQRQETIQREVAYFQNHKEHIHYQQRQQEGCPRGSGAMESTCSQYQDRFKRTGQFRTLRGEQHLLALELARRNDDWDEIWELKHVARSRCARSSGLEGSPARRPYRPR